MLVLPALKQLRVPGEFDCLNYVELGIVCNISGVRILLLSNIKVLAARILYVSLYKSRVSVLLVTVYWQYNRVKSCSVLQTWPEPDILVVLPLLVNNISVICKSELPNTSVFNNGHPTY